MFFLFFFLPNHLLKYRVRTQNTQNQMTLTWGKKNDCTTTLGAQTTQLLLLLLMKCLCVSFLPQNKLPKGVFYLNL